MSISFGGLESIFESVGTKALLMIIMLSIILTIVMGTMIASGLEPEYLSGFVSSVSPMLNIDWMYSGITDLAVAVASISDGLSSSNPLSVVAGMFTGAAAFAKIIASILNVALTGYITIALFVVDMLPGILKPVGVFISLGLVFVQVCVLWVLVKQLLNIGKALAEVILSR